MPKTSFSAAFPDELGAQVASVLMALELPLTHDHGHFGVAVLGKTLQLPYRILFPSIKPGISRLDVQQRRIAQCLLTRSTDGFERQAAMKEVVQIDTPWSAPFVVALAGEYVVEIIDDIYLALPHLDRAVIAAFIRENPAFYKLTCDRVMSYWNCYYRWQFPRRDYVGFRLLRELDALAQQDGKKRPAVQ